MWMDAYVQQDLDPATDRRIRPRGHPASPGAQRRIDARSESVVAEPSAIHPERRDLVAAALGRAGGRSMDTPRFFDMHFWANDVPIKPARALRAALDLTTSRP